MVDDIMPINGEHPFQIASAVGRRIARSAAIDACRKDFGVDFPTCSLDLAIGCRILPQGGSRIGWLALYERSSLAQAISGIWTAEAFGRKAHRASSTLKRQSGDPGNRGGHLPSPRPGSGIHHLVSDQIGRIYSFPGAAGDPEQGNDSQNFASSWLAVSYRADLVRQHRSAIRGKKNDIIRLYRDPPSDGPVVCFDELGPLLTIPRGGKSWGHSPARRSNRYTRKHGTLQFFAAFSPHSGKAVGRGGSRKTSEVCRDFLHEVVLEAWPQGRVHLILDNLSSHKANPVQEWAARHPERIQFHWLPTNSSWLNLIESYFSTLHRVALNNTNYQTPVEIEEGLLKGIAYLNDHPTPYLWKKI